jgi:GH15 family glucan-1,4-alpha-glucosidase
VRVFDFMPPRGKAPDVVRIVEGVRGSVRMRSELVIRFDYGQIVPWVRRAGDTRFAVAGPDALCFRTPAHTRGEDMRTISEFTVEEGERLPFALTWYPSHEDVPERIDPDVALTETESFWREWSAECMVDIPSDLNDVLRRSMMVLKTLIYAPTGASWLRRRPRFRSGSAACATGTTATAGCATRR